MACSHAGARGLWQFMYATAKYQGLRIDSYIDERRDPVQHGGGLQIPQSIVLLYDDWYRIGRVQCRSR